MLARFGSGPVIGLQPLGVGALRRIAMAEDIVRAYQGRAASPNWAEWARANLGAAELLNWAAEIASDGEHG